jgi:hypothetical protein
MEKDLRTANGPIRHLEFLRNFNNKGSGRPTKTTAENIEEVKQRIAGRLQINPSGD